MRKKSIKKNNAKPVAGVIVLIIMTILASLLIIRGISKPVSKISDLDDNTTSTSTAPTAQNDFSDGDDRRVPNHSKDEGSEAIITDDQGNVESVPDKSTWTFSSSGEITLYLPAKNALISSGDKLSGQSTLKNVSFRLIDNVSGVIAQGQLNVVNGKFSGIFDFNTTATDGRLDVFGLKNDGVEFGNIEVPIRFN